MSEQQRVSLAEGRYELTEVAGQGGMATVWKAVMHGAAGFSRFVAIKHILEKLHTNEEFVKMFVEEARVEAKNAGIVKYVDLRTVLSKEGELIVMNRNASLAVVDEKGREKEKYPVVYGAKVKVQDGAKVAPAQELVEWDPYTFSILSEHPGMVKFKDIIEGLTVHEEVDEVTGLMRLIIVDSPDEKKQPAIEIRNEAGKALRRYHMPSHAHLMVGDGDTVNASDVLAKIPTAAD